MRDQIDYAFQKLRDRFNILYLEIIVDTEVLEFAVIIQCQLENFNVIDVRTSHEDFYQALYEARDRALHQLRGHVKDDNIPHLLS